MKVKYSKEAVVIAKCAARGLALATLLLAGSSLAFAQAGGMAGMPGMSGMAKIVIPKGALITVADVQFMQGMIAHHAQAVYMSRLAAGHGANARVLALAKMIDQS